MDCDVFKVHKVIVEYKGIETLYEMYYECSQEAARDYSRQVSFVGELNCTVRIITEKY